MRAAMGSSTLHDFPKNIAPPMPMSVPTDESASLRWCHAFAITAFEFIFRPLYIVYRYNISLDIMEIKAQHKQRL